MAPFLQHLVLKKCATLCDLWMEDVTHLATLHVSQCESLRDIHLPYPVAPLQRLRILSCQKLQSLTCAIQGDLDTVRSLESVTLMQCPALQPPYALWQHAATRCVCCSDSLVASCHKRTLPCLSHSLFPLLDGDKASGISSFLTAQEWTPSSRRESAPQHCLSCAM